jgi:FMN phosphatase YigB (HAD superfamily)
MIKYIFFDVSGTLLGKPVLFDKINEVLTRFGYVVSIDELKYKHKLLSEIIHFPDRTDEVFYTHFNSELLRLLGIVPNEELLKAIFNNCTYLPWEKFEDTKVLSEINVPLGIISNFNTTLKDKLNQFFGPIFKDVLVSEELGVAKPKIAFYERALERLNYTPDEVLYIGDSIKLDIEPAMSLGIKSLLIDRDNFYDSSEYKINSLVEIKNHL